MEYKEVVGRRRSIRFFEPYRPVEREKIQIVLEAARLASCAMNASYLRGIVVNRDEIPAETLDQLTTPVSATNFRLAPTYIFFFGDHSKPLAGNGDLLHKLVDVGAMGPSHGWSHDVVDKFVFPQVIEDILTNEVKRQKIMTFDCGVAASQAYLAAVDEGLGGCFAGFNGPKVKKALGVPDEWLPMYALLLGYPAESWEAGGQRPRPPLGEVFFEGRFGTPFESDDTVVDRLKKDRMIQAPAPLPWRKAELQALARKFNLPE